MIAVFVLTVVLSLFLGGGAWLVLGSRFKMDADSERNDRINLGLYLLGAAPLSFVLVFFGIGA